MMRTLFTRGAVLAVLALVAASDTSAQSIRSVPDSLALVVGDTARLVPVVRNGAGAPIAGAALTFSGTNATAFGISSTGLVTARAPGCGAVRVSYRPVTDHVRAQVPVCVAARPVSPPVVTPPATGAPSMFYNSSEPICAPSNPDILFCDDFEDGDWYSVHCDDAYRTGSLLIADGWCGTIYNPAGLLAGTGRCGNVGLFSNCAATTGIPAGTSANQADHGFVGGQAVDEIWVRYYIQPRAGILFGGEKTLTFNDNNPGDAGIRWANVAFNCGPEQAEPRTPLRVGVPALGVCLSQNVGATRYIENRGDWYFVEIHYRLNTPGQSDGLLEVWLDNCGPTGVACVGNPTLYMQHPNLNVGRTSATQGHRVLWFQAWANPNTLGERYLDAIVASKRGPIGFRRP